MNKKKIIVILITFLTLSILSNVYLLYSNYSLRNILFQEQSSSTPKKKDLMSLMLETEQGSGMYEASKTGEWPDGEYVFNKELSKCENGGELSWDNDKNQVVMVGNSSDKCYLYFNIDTSVTINSFTVTNTETTITISMDAQSTNGAIAKYYYSIDDGENYVSSTSNTYTFSITEIRTYKIKAYAEDGIGRKSGKKSKDQVVTAKPTNPTMAFDSTYNVVISGSTSRNGNVEYYYSLDNVTFTRGSSVTVSSTYYCSKTNAYQSSSTCTYNYTGTRSSSPVCNSAMYPTYHNGKCGSRQIYNYSKSECGSWCSDVAYREKPASYACVQEGTGTESWSCYFYSAEDPFPYTCPNGGNLSGSTCIGATYSGSSRYKCSVSGKYYTTKSSATTGCTNYCANGSLYNSKCYYMS